VRFQYQILESNVSFFFKGFKTALWTVVILLVLLGRKKMLHLET